MSAPQEPATPHPELSPLSIARTIWKKKISILVLWLAITAVVFVIVKRMPTVYSSEALILVDSQKIPDNFVSSTVSTNLQDRIASISQQILSSTRLKRIIEDFNLYQVERKTGYEEDVLEKMRKEISVKLEKGYAVNRPGAFRVTYQGPNPEVVAQVARQLASLFIDENLKTREVQAEGTSEFIDTQLQEAKKRLDELEKSVSDFKVRYNGELPQQEGSLSSTLARLQVELETNRDAINRTQQSKVMLQNELSGAEATLSALSAAVAARYAPGTVTSADPATAVLGETAAPGKKQSELLQARLNALLVTYQPGHPEAQDLAAHVALAREEEAREEKAAEEKSSQPKPPPSPGAANTADSPKEDSPKSPAAQNPRQILDLAQINQRISTLKAQLLLTDQELELRKADHDGIVRQMSAYEARLSKLPIREQEMAQVSRDYEISKANYRSLLDKKYAAEMSTDMERRQKSERFTLLDAPRVPEKPLKPNRPVLDLAGSLLGLLFGLAVAFVREKRQDVLLGEWELPSHVLIVGRLPNIVIPNGKSRMPAGPAPAARRFRPTLRMAVVSTVVICALGAAAWFVVMHR